MFRSTPIPPEPTPTALLARRESFALAMPELHDLLLYISDEWTQATRVQTGNVREMGRNLAQAGVAPRVIRATLPGVVGVIADAMDRTGCVDNAAHVFLIGEAESDVLSVTFPFLDREVLLQNALSAWLADKQPSGRTLVVVITPPTWKADWADPARLSYVVATLN